MSLTAITTPSSPAGAYSFNALRYQWADQYAFTNTVNNGGNLQLTVASGTASEFTAGEFIWLSNLVDIDFIDSPVVEILAVGATSITVDTAYSAGYSTTGNLRGTKALNFVIETGYSQTGSPVKQRILELRPDPSGIYNVNPYQEVISRFAYREPTLGDSGQFDCSVRYRVFPQSAGTGTWLYAFKNDTGNSIGSVIRYSGVPNLVSYVDGGTTIKTNLESDDSTELETSVSIEDDLVVYGFDCASYAFTFDSILAEEFFVFDPESWVSVQLSNQFLTGFTFNFSGENAGEYSWSITYDDGVKFIRYDFTIFIQNTVDCRASCGGRRFFWWSREAGWSSYEFNLAISNEIEGGAAQLKQLDNVVSAVRYERQQQLLTLIAKYEGQAVFDYLKQMLYALNVYEATTFTSGSQVYDLFYVPQASGVAKRTQPYLATSNRFEIELLRGSIENRVNEGR